MLVYCHVCKIIAIVFTVFNIAIVSNPAGTPVSGFINTFDYPILSNVTLTCIADPSPSTTITYQWNTTGCYTNINYNDDKPGCFPHNQTTQSVTGYNLTAEDAGTITCTVTIGGVEYTSRPLTLRISGMNFLPCVYQQIVRKITICNSYRYCCNWKKW